LHLPSLFAKLQAERRETHTYGVPERFLDSQHREAHHMAYWLFDFKEHTIDVG
jgi:hypothetical protein